MSTSNPHKLDEPLSTGTENPRYYMYYKNTFITIGTKHMRNYMWALNRFVP